MATRDEGDPRSPATRYACRNCGADASGGSFCPSCGTPVDAGQATEPSPFERREALRQRIADGLDAGRLPSIEAAQEADFAPPPVPGVDAVPRHPHYAEPYPGLAPPPVPEAEPGTAAPRRGRRALLIGLAALAVAVVAGGAAAAVVLLSRGSDTAAAYRGNVSATFAPVTAANRSLSSALGALHGSDVSAAKRAAARAQSATSSAHGALGALTVPAGSQQLSSQSRQALDREDSYLAAVSSTLANPSNPGASQLQALAGNLTAALDAVGAPLDGAAQSVSGADTLQAWAQQRVAQQQQQQQQQQQNAPVQQVPVPVPVPTPAPNPDGPTLGTVTGTDGAGHNVGVGCSDDPSSSLPGCNDGNGRGPESNLSYGSVTGTDSQGFAIGVNCSNNPSSTLPGCTNG